MAVAVCLAESVAVQVNCLSCCLLLALDIVSTPLATVESATCTNVEVIMRSRQPGWQQGLRRITLQ